jgi:hypothetical protein
MSPGIRLSSLLVVCFLLLIVLHLPARADYTVKQITNNSSTYNPRINNRGMVVWQQWQTGIIYQIFLYKNGNISQISNSSYGGFLPGINDSGQITWWGYDNVSSSYQVYLYNNGSITQISTTNNGNRIEAPSANPEYPHINNNGQVAWIGSDGLSLQVFLYTNGTVYKISHNDEDAQPRGNSGVEINNIGQIVWAGNTTVNGIGNPQIYLYYNGSASQISYPGTSNANEPHLNSNGEIVWRATTASINYYLYYYNTGNISQVVQVNSYATGYAITDSGDILFPGNDGLGYYYDKGIISRISNDITSVGNIVAKGFQSVFPAYDKANHRNLYVFLYGTLKKVSTISSPSDYDISTSGQVTWSGGGIYLGTPRSCGPGIMNLLLD